MLPFPSDLFDLFVMLFFQVFPIKKEVLHPQDEMERHITDLIKKVFSCLQSPCATYFHGILVIEDHRIDWNF